MELRFTGQVIEWRGPAPFFFVAIPEQESADIREVAAVASYGWGVIPVSARVGDVDFETSLFPRTTATSCRSRKPYVDPPASVPATTWLW